MLPVDDPQQLLQEIESSILLSRSIAEVGDEIEKMLLGEFYSKDVRLDEPAPENFPFEYSATVLPRIAFDAPRVTTTVDDDDERIQLLAKGLKHSVNKWARVTSLRNIQKRIAQDTLTSYGVMMTRINPVPGIRGSRGNSRVRPFANRISPRRFFVDHRSSSIEEARYQGHMLIRDKKTLLQHAKNNKDEGWNIDRIEELSADSTLARYYKDPEKQRGPLREEVLLYYLWVPEINLIDHPETNGTIYTVATTEPAGSNTDKKDRNVKFVRDPFPFWGPTGGPYTLFGAYWIGDYVFPLAPLPALHQEVKELNAHATAAAKSAASFKRGIGYDAANKAAGHQLKRFKHGEIFPVPDLAGGTAQQFESGGVDAQMYEYLSVLQDRIIRRSGIDVTKRAGSSRGVTATATAEAASASDSRIEYITREFTDQMGQMLKKVAWYMWHSQFFRSRLDDQAKREDGIEGEFVGGVEEGELGDFDFDMDLSIEVLPRSIGHQSDIVQQRRGQDLLTFLGQIAPTIPQTPWIEWDQALDDYGDMSNNPNYSRYVDMETASQFLGVPIAGSDQPRRAQINIPQKAPLQNDRARASETGALLGAAVKAT